MTGLILFSVLGFTSVWAYKGARSNSQRVRLVLPIVAFVVGGSAISLAFSGLTAALLALAWEVLCIAAVIAAGSEFRDQAMKAVLEAADLPDGEGTPDDSSRGGLGRSVL